MGRQGSSLPSLLDTTPTPYQQQHLTSHPPSSPATPAAPSVGASIRGGTIDPSQVMTPASPRDPRPRTNTLLSSDETTELKISHV